MTTRDAAWWTERARELGDRTAIRRTIHRYAQGIDQRQWDVYRRAFTSDATIEIPGWLPAPIGYEDFVGYLGGEFDSIRISGQHHLANTLVTIAGDTAHAVTEFLAVNAERTQGTDVEVQWAGGLYVDDLIRTSGEWLIRRRVLVRKSDERHIVSYTEQDAAAVASASKNPVITGL